MRKDRSATFSLEQGSREELEKLALKFGKTWGGKPNVSALLDAIASGELVISDRNDDKKRAVAIAQIQEGLGQLMKLLF